VYANLVALEKEFGQRFKPAGLLKKMAKEGRTFY
jgi:hypothetical protein